MFSGILFFLLLVILVVVCVCNCISFGDRIGIGIGDSVSERLLSFKMVLSLIGLLVGGGCSVNVLLLVVGELELSLNVGVLESELGVSS